LVYGTRQKSKRFELVEAYHLEGLSDENIISIAQKRMAADQQLAEAKAVANQRLAGTDDQRSASEVGDGDLTDQSDLPRPDDAEGLQHEGSPRQPDRIGCSQWILLQENEKEVRQRESSEQEELKMSKKVYQTAEASFSPDNCAEQEEAEGVQSEGALEALQFERAEARRRANNRIYAERKRGPTRPLRVLVGAEVYIQRRADAAAILSNPKARQVDSTLLTHQLTDIVNFGPLSKAREMKNDAIRLYASLESKNPSESILNRLQVMMLISVAECHARAARTANPKAIDVNLRHAVNGTNAIIKLMEAGERRNKPKQVMIGEVNIEAGGRAVVGTFQARSKAKRRRKSNKGAHGHGKE